MDCQLSLTSLITLTSLADTNQFRSLRSLHLRIFSSVTLENIGDALDSPTSLFLQALPPLNRLSLTNYFGVLTLSVILAHHGPTLHSLHLAPNPKTTTTSSLITFHRSTTPPFYHSATIVAQIATHCPRLEYLGLPVQRQQGGPQEVAAYRALGKLRRLERVELFLNCGVLPVLVLGCAGSAAEEAQAEREAEAEFLRKLMVNSAVDEVLARAIFGEIAGAGGVLLERLGVKPAVPAFLASKWSIMR
ncbi:hypothetical protein N0V88_007722 [Collariella sp. IMI 366227]|nr:hypothetical protein N0V88_007722 [Collariella sp. IMI 366227]